MGLQFGAVGATNVAEGTYGYLQNFNRKLSCDEGTAVNASGVTIAQTIFNEVEEVDCEYIFDSATTLPEVGSSIVIGATNKYAVMSVERTESNTEYTKAKITMKRYMTVGVPTNY